MARGMVFLGLLALLLALAASVRIGPQEIRAALALMAATQGGLLLAFAWLLRRGIPDVGRLPPATLLVACKGDLEGLEENVASLLEQDYPGRLEVLFVVPAESDPAFRRIKAVLPEGKGKLLATERVPERCSGKIADLLHALGRVAPETEILLFADADIHAPRRWARDLGAALAEPGTGASTTACLHAPARPSFWAFMKLLWMGAGLPYFACFPFVWAGSFALRRETFERLGIAKIWERSLLDDGPLDTELKRNGLRVAFVPAAMPLSTAGSSAGDFLGQFGRWLMYAKYYKPILWLAGGLGLAAKTGIALWSLGRPTRFWALAALAALDGAYLSGVLLALRSNPRAKLSGMHPVFRFPEVLAALLSPLVTLAWLACFTRALLAREIRWGGYRYRLHGPFDVEVEPLARAQRASPASRTAASR